jgi:hypothetical protein
MNLSDLPIAEIKDVIVALSALGAVIIGWRGLQEWKAELAGRAQFEAAKKLLKLAFQFREQFGIVRSPMTYATEYIGREKSEKETPTESSVLDEWYAKSERLKPLLETSAQMREASWEAEIVIGIDGDELIQPFRDVAKELSVAIRGYFDTNLMEARSSDPSRNLLPLETKKQLHGEIYGMNDDFEKGVDEGIETLKQRLEKHLRPRF